MKPFMFGTDNRTGRGYKLVVFAKTLKAAREHARQSHNKLKFVGQGEPDNKDGWTAATCRIGL